jgi:integrase/recombinase XerD
MPCVAPRMAWPSKLGRPQDRREVQVVRYWQESGYADNTIRGYLGVVRQLRPHLLGKDSSEERCLTRRRVEAAAVAYSRAHGYDRRTAVHGALAALHSWAVALRTFGVEVPEWLPRSAPGPFDELLAEYAHHRKQYRGISSGSLRCECRYVQYFLSDLRRRRRLLVRVTPADLDRFTAALGKQFAPKSVELACSSIRGLLRFLHASGKLPQDLSCWVTSPAMRRSPQRPRALPWDDVRRILRAIDRRTAIGRRDYALLLLMASYGMGAGEVLGLRLGDIDWRTHLLRVVRPKTGVETILPLLPAVGRAIASYLRRGRPGTTAREIFLRAKAPHRALGAAPAITYRLLKYARLAGVSAPYLSSHVLRHSHASRQTELGVPPKVLSDILGHSDPRSTSTYTRVATERLRAVALPVPR